MENLEDKYHTHHAQDSGILEAEKTQNILATDYVYERDE